MWPRVLRMLLIDDACVRAVASREVLQEGLGVRGWGFGVRGGDLELVVADHRLKSSDPRHAEHVAFDGQVLDLAVVSEPIGDRRDPGLLQRVAADCEDGDWATAWGTRMLEREPIATATAVRSVHMGVPAAGQGVPYAVLGTVWCE